MMPIVVESQWGSNSEFVAIDASLAAKLPDTVGILNPLRPLVSLTVIQTLDRLTQIDHRARKCRFMPELGRVGWVPFAIQYAKHVLGMEVATSYRFQGKS
jgi:hypothetical protein